MGAGPTCTPLLLPLQVGGHPFQLGANMELGPGLRSDGERDGLPHPTVWFVLGPAHPQGGAELSQSSSGGVSVIGGTV